MTYPNRECLMCEPVSSYLRRRGFRLQGRELAFYEYRIDIYGFSPKTSRTVAIELKLEKWRRAYEQSLIYQLCSDLVYMALPARVVPRVHVSLLRESGVGLISLDGSCRCKTILPARQSPAVRQFYRETLVANLRGEGG